MTWGVPCRDPNGLNTGSRRRDRRRWGFAVGDAVNVAARLEHGEPGEILIGESTYGWSATLSSWPTACPLDIKGKSEPIAAWNVVRLSPGRRDGSVSWTRRSSGGRTSSTICGERSTGKRSRQGSGELVTVMGPAGVGKSRLTRFLAGVADRSEHR